MTVRKSRLMKLNLLTGKGLHITLNLTSHYIQLRMWKKRWNYFNLFMMNGLSLIKNYR